VQVPPGHPEAVEQTMERLRAVPGVSSATASMWPLFTAAPDTYIQVCIPGDTPKDFDDRYADSDVVLPRFFETWGVPLLSGRDFINTGGPGNVIVNQAFVKRYLKGDAIGQSFHWGPACAAAATIIAVVADSTDRPRIAPRPFVYRRWAQPPPQMTYTVRTTGSEAAVAPALDRIVKDLNTRVRVFEQVTTGTQYRDDTMSQERLYAWLLSGFGMLALLVACLGIYGMLAYLVARRTAEIGIRMALGARSLDVMGMVMRESLAPVAAGIVAGLIAAYRLTRVVASLLFGVSRNDPWSIAGAASALLLTAALGASLPARRATRVDPMRALKYE
jgi:predicted permease